MDDFHTSRLVRARKAHVCWECRQVIAVGATYLRWAQRSDGDFWEGKSHPDCEQWADGALYTPDLAYCGEARPALHEFDPEEDDFNERWIAANPPSSELLARLPKGLRDLLPDDGASTAPHTLPDTVNSEPKTTPKGDAG